MAGDQGHRWSKEADLRKLRICISCKLPGESQTLTGPPLKALSNLSRRKHFKALKYSIKNVKPLLSGKAQAFSLRVICVQDKYTSLLCHTAQLYLGALESENSNLLVRMNIYF